MIARAPLATDTITKSTMTSARCSQNPLAHDQVLACLHRLTEAHTAVDHQRKDVEPDGGEQKAADDGDRRQTDKQDEHERRREVRPEALEAVEDVAHLRLLAVSYPGDHHAVEAGEQRSGEHAQGEHAERSGDQRRDEQRSEVLDEQARGLLESEPDVESAPG